MQTNSWAKRIVGTGGRGPLILSLIILAAFMVLRGLGDTSIGYPDADRILMDGVFIADTLRDMPLTHPWSYAQAYFVQYPALSIGYRPPFFPLIEGLFNLAFGINMWSSRLALFCMLIVGIIFWFRLAEDLADRRVAFFSSALWLTTPFLVQWGWYTMAELPVVSMTLVALYYLNRWLRTESGRDALMMALFIGIAAWTKQTAAFLILVVLAYVLACRRFLWAVKRPAHWGAAALLVAIVIPLGVMTWIFADQNLAQSVGPMTADRAPRFSLANWLILFKTLAQSHLTLPVLVLSLIGGVAAIRYRVRAALLPALVILAAYIFFSLMVGKNARYPIFWIPAWCFLAALPLWLLRDREKLRMGFMALLGLVVLYQAVRVYELPASTASGYDKAAQIAVREATTPGIFIDAYNNGYFTYFARQADKDRQHYIFRGDKLLSSSSIGPGHWQEVHLHTADEIVKLFDQLAISTVVVESINYMNLPIHAKLRTLLEGPDFEKIATIDVASNKVLTTVPGQPRLDQEKLYVYRYLHAKSTMSGDIALRLPVVGKTIRRDLNDKEKP